MSWAAKYKITLTPVDNHAQVDLESSQLQSGNGEKESADAINEAIQIAQLLVESGKFGLGTFSVNLNGHANDGNKPKEGWSNDFVNIQIYQVSNIE
jgi:hypothetical protein